jgi:hypothetical protein
VERWETRERWRSTAVAGVALAVLSGIASNAITGTPDAMPVPVVSDRRATPKTGPSWKFLSVLISDDSGNRLIRVSYSR